LQNPVQDVLTLNTSSEIQNVLVYNMSGQTFEVTRLGEFSYDVSGLRKGVYTVMAIGTDGNNMIGKILKQ
jgi:ribosomal protein S6